MTRTTITLPEELLRRARQAAAERGTSMAELVREALEHQLERERPKPRSLGLGESQHRYTARQTAEQRPKPRS